MKKEIPLREFIDRLKKFEKENPKATITTHIECKACFKLSDVYPVRFFRIDQYERRRKMKDGVRCDKCGYLNAE